jgi:hypothetical protein
MMMQDSKTPFYRSKFPWARERIYPKIINNLGTSSQKGSLALAYEVSDFDRKDFTHLRESVIPFI